MYNEEITYLYNDTSFYREVTMLQPSLIQNKTAGIIQNSLTIRVLVVHNYNLHFSPQPFLSCIISLIPSHPLDAFFSPSSFITFYLYCPRPSYLFSHYSSTPSIFLLNIFFVIHPSVIQHICPNYFNCHLNISLLVCVKFVVVWKSHFLIYRLSVYSLFFSAISFL